MVKKIKLFLGRKNDFLSRWIFHSSLFLTMTRVVLFALLLNDANVVITIRPSATSVAPKEGLCGPTSISATVIRRFKFTDVLVDEETTDVYLTKT